MTSHTPWTPELDEILRRLYAEKPVVRWIARAMGVHHNRITARVKMLGLNLAPALQWTPRENEILRALWNDGVSDAEMTPYLPGRSEDAIQQHRTRIGMINRKNEPPGTTIGPLKPWPADAPRFEDHPKARPTTGDGLRAEQIRRRYGIPEIERWSAGVQDYGALGA